MIRKILLAGALALALIGFSGGFSGKAASNLKEFVAAKPAVKYVKLSNGLKIQYAEQGDSSGVPVILLHGYGDSLRSFDLVLPHLPKSLRAFALTQRGHGDSEHPVSGYHVRDFSADVAAFMDAMKLKKATIVGHSMGSYVAQRFALDHPDRVRGLVLIGSFVTVRGNPGVKELWDSTISKFGDSVDSAFIRDFQQSTFQKPIPPEFFETVVRESANVPGRVWRTVMAELMQTDFSAELGRIKTTTLIVWGNKDSFFLRDEQERLAKAIAGSKLLIYEGIGHCPNWEAPERLAADLLAFIDALDR